MQTTLAAQEAAGEGQWWGGGSGGAHCPHWSQHPADTQPWQRPLSNSMVAETTLEDYRQSGLD